MKQLTLDQYFREKRRQEASTRIMARIEKESGGDFEKAMELLTNLPDNEWKTIHQVKEEDRE